MLRVPRRPLPPTDGCSSRSGRSDRIETTHRPSLAGGAPPGSVYPPGRGPHWDSRRRRSRPRGSAEGILGGGDPVRVGRLALPMLDISRIETKSEAPRVRFELTCPERTVALEATALAGLGYLGPVRVSVLGRLIGFGSPPHRTSTNGGRPIGRLRAAEADLDVYVASTTNASAVGRHLRSDPAPRRQFTTRYVRPPRRSRWNASPSSAA